MASDGFLRKAKKGTCRICKCTRGTQYLKAVGEVRHGFALGYIWECEDEDVCTKKAHQKLESAITNVTRSSIEHALQEGRYKQYIIRT